MQIIKKLDSQKLIDEACALLYREFVKSGEWIISEDNPSNIKVITKNGRNLLVDRITPYATWFGIFEDSELVACIRIFKATKAVPFEIEIYPSAANTLEYINAAKPDLYEITRACVAAKYRGRRTLNKLYLTVFEYIQKNKSSAFGSVSNPYVKNLIRLIEWPCKVENAFKFEEQDPLPVNFYLAEYKNGEINNIVNRLNLLENSQLINNHITILDALNLVAPILPTPIYWHDINGAVLGLNDSCLQTMGAPSRESIIGKTPYDFYPKETADMIWNHSKKVIATGETLSQEEAIHDITTGEYRAHLAIKSPLYDEYGKVIGVIGTSVNITAEKEAERLKLGYQAQKAEIEKQQAVMEEQTKFRELIEEVSQILNKFKISNMNDKLGISQPAISNGNVKLSKREKEVLYFLALNKSPKEIAAILTSLDDKEISPKSIQAVIDKQLYRKLDVYNQGQLIEKAHFYQLIPFVLN